MLREERKRGRILQGLYPILYVAARNGEVELLDAIIGCRQCVVSIGLLINYFITAQNFSEVERAIAYIEMQYRVSDKEAWCRKRLSDWIDGCPERD